MNFHFTETVALQIGEHVQQRPFILFSREKIRMAKRRAVVIADGITSRARQLTPLIKTLQRCIAQSWFEMIGNHEDYMRLIRGVRPPRKLAGAPKRIAQQPGQRPPDLVE